MKYMNLKKKLYPLVAGAALTCASCVPVLASGETGGLASVESALTSSFTEVGSSATSLVGKILPIALPIVGAVLIIGLGLKIFKKVTNKV